MGRLKQVPDPNEKEALRALLVQCHGNLSRMARELGNTDRQGLTRRLAAHELLEEASQLRGRHAVKGPRDAGEVDPAERKDLLEEIARHGYRKVAERRQLGARTLLRRMAALRITRKALKRERVRLGLA